MKRIGFSRFNTLKLAICLAFLSACSSVNTTDSGAVGIERKQLMSPLVSEKQMDATALQAYRDILAKEAKQGDLNSDPVLTRRVRAVAARLIPHTAVFRKDAPSWQWEINVIKSDELNAWCMPGGKIAFYSGIIQKLNLTDDEIAAVMGHEISHALREHSRERASEQMTAGLGLNILAAVTGVGQGGADLMGALYNVTFSLPNSRTHETEADRMGVELAARAGYNPHAAVTVWEKMGKFSQGQPPQFLSTHPSHETRIADLTEYARKVQPLYEQVRR
ncbi:M48 family metallopeptidase [Parvibium lacunae]|uniref:M48 family peptidase n=1 Tax=Parvibium lacunae TaxID=1888893 RepID=A0A368L8I7_9BURK|nr:M48 family metallopeptidase [Parvibium lacunae]RCS59831.1 M48 family peptidase [Parvibium lacunae]